MDKKFGNQGFNFKGNATEIANLSVYGNTTLAKVIVPVVDPNAAPERDYDLIPDTITPTKTKKKSITISDSDLEKYMCGQSDMYFYSSTGGDTPIGQRDNQMVLDLDCNVFTYKNQSSDHIALHYHFGDTIKARESMNKVANISVLEINRLDSNEQFFNFSLSKELEFMQVKRNTMYVNEWEGPTPSTEGVTNDESFEAFKQDSAVNMIFDTYSQVITEDDYVPIVMAAKPVHIVKKGIDSDLQVLGISLTYKDRDQRVLNVQPSMERV